MKLLIATGNPHKVEEIQAVMRAAGLELACLADLPQQYDEPVEDQPTFAGNAALKARHYARCTGWWCLADDSGLEVDALHGAPGVRSARYALDDPAAAAMLTAGGAQPGRKDIDRANNLRLLRELGDLPAGQRTARFVCTMALAGPASTHDEVFIQRGTIEGRILGPGDLGYALDNPAGRGRNGFGYDPLFLVPSLGLTTAEISPEHKNAISHRGQATRALWPTVQQLLSGK